MPGSGAGRARGEPAGGRATRAAFGPSPEADVAAGGSARRRWLRAVALGGRGRYAAAATELGALLADPGTPAGVAAHAAVTLASHRRQQGGHAVARVLDARGLRLAFAARSAAADRDGTDPLAARVDALVGLAADALGLGSTVVAARLLDAADAVGHPSWRPRVRSGWVRAELALVSGRAAAAIAPAEEALNRAARAGSARHVLKSRLVLAVAHGSDHPNGAVLDALDAVGDEAQALGQLPLVWPSRLAAADVADRIPSPHVSVSLQNANDGGSNPRRGSVKGPASGAARRRHAAAVTLSVLYQYSDPIGRGLMGEPVWTPPQLPLT